MKKYGLENLAIIIPYRHPVPHSRYALGWGTVFDGYPIAQKSLAGDSVAREVVPFNMLNTQKISRCSLNLPILAAWIFAKLSAKQITK